MIIKPTRSSGIAELLGSKPKSSDMVAPKKSNLVVSSSVIPEPDNWLKNIMDETLEKDQVLWAEPVRYFRGSEVGDPCLRSLCLSVMGHRMPIEANLRRIFDAGKNIEKVNVDTMIKAGLCPTENYTQASIKYPDPPIQGHTDVIVLRDKAKIRRYLGEIKSINEWPFKSLPKEHGPMLASKSPLFEIKTPHKYIMQWNCYAGAPNMTFDEGFLLFEEKNTSAQKFYWLKRDDELLEKMFIRLRLAAPYILSDPMLIPPYSLNMEEPPCKTCNRKYLCKNLPDYELDYTAVRNIDKELRG
ncbi:MAG TPA: hypothetical protein ENI23_04145 [bacterium]|nr:hypothetical protein [bacterium]